MNKNKLERANQLREEIVNIKNWWDWCSGLSKYEIGKYPASLVAKKKKVQIGIFGKQRGIGAITSQEYELSNKLQNKIMRLIEEHIEELEAEFEQL